MTELLERALEAVRRMPPADQEMVARVMLDMARPSDDPAIDPDELREAREGLAQVDRGEVATDEEVEAAFRRFHR